MIAVLSETAYKAFEKATGIKAFPLKGYSRLTKPIASHADMLICNIENYVFCYKDYYFENYNVFDEIENLGYKIVRVEHNCSPIYPGDIGLNVLVMGKAIFCNINYAAKEIVKLAQRKNYKIIDVKQGYSCCSTLVLNDNVAITADLGMKAALEKENKKVVLIKGNNIKLKGYNCGFIGGSGGVYNHKAYFFGDIRKTDDYEKISAALKQEKIDFNAISPGDVCDFGGIKFFCSANKAQENQE